MKNLKLVLALMLTGVVYGVNESLIRGFEANYRKCMERQEGSVGTGENCIRDLANNLINYAVLPSREVNTRVNRWKRLYGKASDDCRGCKRTAFTQQGRNRCYAHHVGFDGFTLLDNARLSADKVIQDYYDYEEEKAMQLAYEEADRLERLNQYAQDLEHQLTECYQRAGNSDSQIAECYQIYREAMQANNLQVREDLRKQAQDQWTILAILSWPFQGWWK